MIEAVTSRRLAAVVFADVVGYTRLMAEDEAATLAGLRTDRRDIVLPMLERCGGRLVKFLGDGALFDFPSAVEAVRFSVLTQSRIAQAAEAADTPPEARRIRYRIGVDLGDIVIDGDDIYGDGVNAASRLEAMAEPGGVCLSNSVRRQISGKLELDLEDLGPLQVKNIAEPIRAWRVEMNDRARVLSDAPVLPAVPEQASSRRPLAMVAAAVLVVVAALGLWIGGFGYMGGAQAPPDLASRKVAASLLVLPFEDLSPNKSLGYFADGMTEDLITDLARWQELDVAARNATLQYRSARPDIRTAARDNGAEYVLEGTVRPAGDGLRVTAQLIDGGSGDNVWAERFDETGTDVLALQDRVIRKITQSLIGNYGVIREDEYAKTWAKADVDLQEYDYYLRGHSLFYQYNPESNEKALAVWREGLTKFPESGLLMIKVGWGLMIGINLGWQAPAPPILARISELVEEGMADPELPPAGHRFGLWLQARVYGYTGDYEKSIRAAREVAAAYPFDLEGLYYTGVDLMVAGEVEVAGEFIDRAKALDRSPSPIFLTYSAWVRFSQGRYEDAIADSEATRDDVTSLWKLAASHAALGNEAEAARYVSILESVFPAANANDIRGWFPWRDPEVPDRLIALLTQAGWAPQS